MLRVLLVLASLLAPSFAQEPIALPSPGVVPPVLTHQVDPVMPHRFVAGVFRVVVKCVVDVHGIPEQVEVVTPGGKKYDNAAVAAVEQYRFSPATKDGTPVPVSLLVDVTFQYGRR